MEKLSGRVLAKGVIQNNNSQVTQLNNNDIVIGPSGAGKTSGYVIPNLLYSEESKIVVDTKSTLYDRYGEELRNRGYKVQCLDFSKEDSIGYNMFEYIAFDEDMGLYDDQDIMTIAKYVVPDGNEKDPYWSTSARGLLTAMIALVLEEFGNGQDTWRRIMNIYSIMNEQNFKDLFTSALEKDENSFAYKMYRLSDSVKDAKQTKACIDSNLASRLIPISSYKINQIFEKEERIDFRRLGDEKTVLFISISDMDRSKDPIYSILFAQAFQQLCKVADESEEKALKIPVRIILDDFAANVKIDAFDKLTSVIRSRNVSVSIILQSISQLNAVYNNPEAVTIINNCDHMLYLGGQDYETAKVVANRLDKSTKEVLEMPLSKAYVFERGRSAQSVERFNIYNTMHIDSLGLI